MSISTADKLEIMELASRYNYAVDHKDAEAWADCFTDDGEFKVNGQLVAQGRAAFVAFVKAKGADWVTRHWTNNAIIDGNEDMARLRLYVTAYSVVDGALAAPYVMGEYDDTVVKSGGRWKFKQRHMQVAAGKSRTGK